MKIGIAIPNFGKYASKNNITRLTLAAEKYGFDSIWLSDHIVIPKSHKGFGNNFYEPLTTLSYLAPITKTINLGTSIIVLPYRNPIVLAKAVSTLDQLSDGRIILGIGSGWLKEEFEALGADFDNRKARTDEYLRIINVLWNSRKPQYQGQYYNFSNISFLPKPKKGYKIPVWFGGNSNEAINKAIEHCDGWHSVGLSPEEIKTKLEYIGDALSLKENIKSDFIISVRKNLQLTNDIKINLNKDEPLRGDKEKITRGLQDYKVSGVKHIILYILSSSLNGIFDTMKVLATEIRAEFN